jgi:sucrose-6-phosphatase
MIQPLLICTDLDRTLIPNGEQPESPQARLLFCQLVSNSQITLAYVTGRDQVLVQEAMWVQPFMKLKIINGYV